MAQLPPLSHCATASQLFAEAVAVERPNGMAARAPAAATKVATRVLIFRFCDMRSFLAAPTDSAVWPESLSPVDVGVSRTVGQGLSVFGGSSGVPVSVDRAGFDHNEPISNNHVPVTTLMSEPFIEG